MTDDYVPLEGGDSAKGSHTATAGNSPEGLIASNPLVERLRRPMLIPSVFLCREAADELDRLAARCAELKTALQSVKDVLGMDGCEYDDVRAIRQIIDAALQETKP